MINDISTATIEVKGWWNCIFSRIIEDNHQLRLYTQQKYFSKMMQLKLFSEKQKLGVYYQKPSQMENFLAVLQIGGK